MATLQSLPPSFRPSIPPPNSHSFPATPFNYSPKLIASKGVSVTLRNSITSPRVSVSNSEYSPQIAENLGDVTIFTAAGEPVRFSDLWDQSQVNIPHIHGLKLSFLSPFYNSFVTPYMLAFGYPFC